MRVEVHAPSTPELRRFLKAWSFKPHSWGWRGPPDPLDTLLFERVQNTISAEGARVWSATGSGRLTGLAVLRPLAWDSRVLGWPAARLELFAAGVAFERRATARTLLTAAILGAREQRLRHLSIRVDAADDAAIHALEEAGFLNVDALLTFAAATEDLPALQPSDGIGVRSATAGDSGAIESIAAASFRDGRFHADPSVPSETAREVYRLWAAACCDRSAADMTIVAVDDIGPVGFIACRILGDTAVHLQRATGTIPLVAIGESVRGRGLGRVLVAAAAQWFGEEHAAVVEVGTQLRNVAAARLYEQCGFRLVAGSLSFRLMIEA